MITDVVMPQLSGPELARRLAQLAPDMAVVFVLGYAPDAVLGQTILDPAAAYVQKPFTPDTLARKAREVLDRTRRPHYRGPGARTTESAHRRPETAPSASGSSCRFPLHGAG